MDRFFYQIETKKFELICAICGKKTCAFLPSWQKQFGEIRSICGKKIFIKKQIPLYENLINNVQIIIY